jgi:hypothetical protein
VGSTPSPIPEIQRDEKLHRARGAGENAGEPRLDELVALAADADKEVSQAAQETLGRLSNEDCARQLIDPALPEAVGRYFLDPKRVRPALLKILLANPGSPQDAIVGLAAEANEEILPLLAENLDFLKTPALLALRKNPVYVAAQKAAAPVLPAAEEARLALARGTRAIPEAQRLRTLVMLTADPSEAVRQAAEDMLGDMAEEDCAELLAERTLDEPVARYFLEPQHVRAPLLPLLLTHPAIPQDAITDLAATAGISVIPELLDNIDLLKTPALIALKGNQSYVEWQKAPPAEGLVIEVDLLDLLIAEAELEDARIASGQQPVLPPLTKEEEKKEGLSGRIARMGVAQKVKMALLGNREERSILIRDGSKVVSRAALSSPKLTDSEVEAFAAMKNVDQEVLRGIATNRKFMKNYSTMKTLVNNPRLPIDIGLAQIPRLIQTDLLFLSKNRDVSEIIRKMADKLSKTRKG